MKCQSFIQKIPKITIYHYLKLIKISSLIVAKNTRIGNNLKNMQNCIFVYFSKIYNIII